MPLSVASTGINGRQPVTYTNRVARTDTTAKDLFVLEAGDIPISLALYSATASNAGTTAALSIGSTSNATYFVNAVNVKAGPSQSGQSVPSTVTNLMEPLAFQTTVTGTYAETGSASSAGGPWTVMMQVIKR